MGNVPSRPLEAAAASAPVAVALGLLHWLARSNARPFASQPTTGSDSSRASNASSSSRLVVKGGWAAFTATLALAYFRTIGRGDLPIKRNLDGSLYVSTAISTVVEQPYNQALVRMLLLPSLGAIIAGLGLRRGWSSLCVAVLVAPMPNAG